MNKRTNRYFHRFGLRSWPIYKVWIAGFMAVVLLTGSLLGAGYGSQLVAWAEGVISTPLPSATPAVTAAATPEPEEEPEAPKTLEMEVTVIQQDIGIDLFLVEEEAQEEETAQDKDAQQGESAEDKDAAEDKTADQDKDAQQDTAEDGEPQEEENIVPLLNTPFNVLVTDSEDNTETYPVDTETGTLLLEEVEPGDYTITLEEQEGYIIPEAQTVTVKEKVVYTVKEEEVEEVKDKVVQSNEVVESQEDNAYGNDTVVVEELQDTVSYADSKTETVAGPSLTKAKTDSNGFMVLSDGTVTDYKPVYDSNGNLSAAQRSGSREIQGAPVAPLTDGENASAENPEVTPTPTAEATPTPTPETTPTPTPTPVVTPTPTPEATATPTTEPTPSVEPSATPTAAPTTTPTAAPTVTPTVSPTPTATSAPAYTTWPDTIKAADMGKYSFATTTEKTEQVVYTGWQTIDGKTYYYDPSTHKPVTGQQVIQGIMYNFDANGVKTNQLRGIDVSKYQGNINWSAVKSSGIDFAIIRAGYRGYGTGALVEDSKFKANIQGATAAGIPVGVYFYSQAVTEEEAREEALMVIGLVKGYKISYPIYFDTEKVAGDTGRADGLSAAQRTACAVAFCETIRAAGYTAGVYSYRDWFYYNLNYANISKYRIWIAQYRSTLDFKYNYQIWQYTSSGSVNGISGRVDMNITR